MGNPKRVLMIFTVMNRGGAETMIMNYYRKIDRNKLQFDFVVHRSQKGAYDDEIRSLGGKIYVFPPVRPQNFGKYKKLIRHFLDEHPEYSIIHSHAQELSYYFYKIAYEKGIPHIITHSHNASMLWDFKAPLRLFWRKRMFQYINHYFTCGIEAGKHYFGSKRAKETLWMPNAIDISKFKFNVTARKKIRQEFGIKDHDFVIGHIGRFTPQKNHPFILNIFKAFAARNVQAKLMLVGEEDKKKVIRAKITKSGIADLVILAGTRTDIPDILSAFDCILMPSLFEGVSVAMIEAQASGCPLITSTNVPAEVGLIPSTEFISLHANINDWVQTIEKYLEQERNPNAPEIIAQAGYDISSCAQWLTNYYLSLPEK